MGGASAVQPPKPVVDAVLGAAPIVDQLDAWWAKLDPKKKVAIVLAEISR